MRYATPVTLPKWEANKVWFATLFNQIPEVVATFRAYPDHCVLVLS